MTDKTHRRAWIILALTLSALLPIVAANNTGGEEQIDAGTLIAYEYDGREFHTLHGTRSGSRPRTKPEASG
jgi:hypothetical protein